MSIATDKDARIAAFKTELVNRAKEDRREREAAGICIHGRYVGGMGIDWICQSCEDGYSIEEMTDDYVDSLVEEVTDVLAVAAVLDRMSKRFSYETPTMSDLRDVLIKMYTQIWEDADKRAMFQILHDKMGA